MQDCQTYWTAKFSNLFVEKSETELSKIPVTVYNFQVEDFHTYYVGTNGVLVHNANCKLIDSGDGTYDVELSYKDDWTPEQRIEADNKVRVLSEAETIKTTPNRGNTSASSTYKREYGNNSVLRTQDVDHVVDLQLGGQTILVT